MDTAQIKRFLGSYPSVLATIALLFINLISPFAKLTYQQSAVLSVFVVLVWLLWAYGQWKKKTHSEVLTGFQNWMTDFRRLVSEDNKDSPVSNIDELCKHQSRIAFRHEPGGAIVSVPTYWDCLGEKTKTIHHILMEDLNYFGDLCASLATDPGYLEATDVKRLADNFWRILWRYHDDVIEPLLRMREELAPEDRAPRRSLSKFRTVYLDVLKQMRDACQKANSAFHLTLETKIDELILPEID
jgi:hypothetical protein